jgi:hypothetical protein
MEDRCRIRRGTAPSFWSAMRKIAFNVLKLFPGKESMGDKMSGSFRDNAYLLKILNFFNGHSEICNSAKVA